jgi:hypothetical protein
LRISADGIATGAVASDTPGCARKAPVELQIETDQAWMTVATGKAKTGGAYRMFGPPGDGHFRTLVRERKVKGAKGAETCAQGVSAPVRIGG